MSAGTLFSWSVDLGRQMPQKRLVVVGFAIMAGILGYFVLHGVLGFFLGAGIVIASIGELFFPLKYRLDDEEASVRCGLSTTAIRWQNVKRVVTTDGGVKLSPLEKSSRLDAFRGVYVRFSGNEAEVLAKIAQLAQQYGIHMDGRADSKGAAETHRSTDL